MHTAAPHENPAVPHVAEDEGLELDVSFVAAGVPVQGMETEDCTSDGCGDTSADDC